jgi:hypothetical protein
VTTAAEKRRSVGDWVIPLGTGIAAIAMVGVLLLTLVLQLDNRHLLTQVTALEKTNKQLILQSNRNHADTLIVQQDLKAFCAAYHVACVVVPVVPTKTGSTSATVRGNTEPATTVTEASGAVLPFAPVDKTTPLAPASASRARVVPTSPKKAHTSSPHSLRSSTSSTCPSAGKG